MIFPQREIRVCDDVCWLWHDACGQRACSPVCEHAHARLLVARDALAGVVDVQHATCKCNIMHPLQWQCDGMHGFGNVPAHFGATEQCVCSGRRRHVGRHRRQAVAHQDSEVFAKICFGHHQGDGDPASGPI